MGIRKRRNFYNFSHQGPRTWKTWPSQAICSECRHPKNHYCQPKMTMIVDQFHIPQNNHTLASRIMRTIFFLTISLISNVQGQNRLYQPKSEMLSQRHKSQAPAPIILPYIYVYHRWWSPAIAFEISCMRNVWREMSYVWSPLSHPGTLPEALKGKQVAKVGKDGDLPLILKSSKIPFAILKGGEIFVCQIGLKIHIMKLEINMPLKQQD